MDRAGRSKRGQRSVNSNSSGCKSGIAAQHLTSWCPEDLIFHIHGFLPAKDLCAAGQASREFYFAAYLAARDHFVQAFGAAPDPSLPRRSLFKLVDAVRDLSLSETSMRDLFLWSCMRGYVKMVAHIVDIAPKHTQIAETVVAGVKAAPLSGGVPSRDLSGLGPAPALSAASAAAVPPSANGSVDGRTPLLLAVEHDRLAVVELLLKHGADVNRAAGNGLQAMHVAARMGLCDVMECLLQHDPELAHAGTFDGRTPLLMAASEGHADCAKMLIDAGADVDAATAVHDDQGSETAMHVASYHGHADVVSMLLSAGANPNIQLRNGRTPLLLACEMGWGDVVLLLLTRSFRVAVDLCLTTDSGKTALNCACEHGHAHLVPLLLAAGSDPMQPTRRARIPLHAAAERGHIDIARMLLEHNEELASSSASKHSRSLSMEGDSDGVSAIVAAPSSRYSASLLQSIASKSTNKAMKDLILSYEAKELARSGGSKGKGVAGAAKGMLLRLARDRDRSTSTPGRGGLGAAMAAVTAASTGVVAAALKAPSASNTATAAKHQLHGPLADHPHHQQQQQHQVRKVVDPASPIESPASQPTQALKSQHSQPPLQSPPIAGSTSWRPPRAVHQHQHNHSYTHSHYGSNAPSAESNTASAASSPVSSPPSFSVPTSDGAGPVVTSITTTGGFTVTSPGMSSPPRPTAASLALSPTLATGGNTMAAAQLRARAAKEADAAAVAAREAAAMERHRVQGNAMADRARKRMEEQQQQAAAASASEDPRRPPVQQATPERRKGASAASSPAANSTTSSTPKRVAGVVSPPRRALAAPAAAAASGGTANDDANIAAGVDELGARITPPPSSRTPAKHRSSPMPTLVPSGAKNEADDSPAACGLARSPTDSGIPLTYPLRVASARSSGGGRNQSRKGSVDVVADHKATYVDSSDGAIRTPPSSSTAIDFTPQRDTSVALVVSGRITGDAANRIGRPLVFDEAGETAHELDPGVALRAATGGHDARGTSTPVDWLSASLPYTFVPKQASDAGLPSAATVFNVAARGGGGGAAGAGVADVDAAGGGGNGPMVDDAGAASASVSARSVIARTTPRPIGQAASLIAASPTATAAAATSSETSPACKRASPSDDVAATSSNNPRWRVPTVDRPIMQHHQQQTASSSPPSMMTTMTATGASSLRSPPQHAATGRHTPPPRLPPPWSAGSSGSVAPSTAATTSRPGSWLPVTVTMGTSALPPAAPNTSPNQPHTRGVHLQQQGKTRFG